MGYKFSIARRHNNPYIISPRAVCFCDIWLCVFGVPVAHIVYKIHKCFANELGAFAVRQYVVNKLSRQKIGIHMNISSMHTYDQRKEKKSYSNCELMYRTRKIRSKATNLNIYIYFKEMNSQRCYYNSTHNCRSDLNIIV